MNIIETTNPSAVTQVRKHDTLTNNRNEFCVNQSLKINTGPMQTLINYLNGELGR